MTHKHATCRTRSSALHKDTRLGVRSSVCGSWFPLAKSLPSPISAARAAAKALFDRLSGTMDLSDFPTPYIAAVPSLRFSARTGSAFWPGQCRDLPVPVQKACTRAVVLGPRRVRWRLVDNAPTDVAFRTGESVGTLMLDLFAAQ